MLLDTWFEEQHLSIQRYSWKTFFTLSFAEKWRKKVVLYDMLVSEVTWNLQHLLCTVVFQGCQCKHPKSKGNIRLSQPCWKVKYKSCSDLCHWCSYHILTSSVIYYWIRRTATWNLFVLHDNEQPFFISKYFNITRKPAFCPAFAPPLNQKKSHLTWSMIDSKWSNFIGCYA